HYSLHNDNARLHPSHSFQKLSVTRNTASKIIPCPQQNCETTPRWSRSRSYAYRKTLPLQSNKVHNETERLRPDVSFQKLCVPQNSASTINQSPQRNCEATPRCLVPEATRTAKHCLYNQPKSTTKLRDYAQVSRSRSYAYRKTLPLHHPLSTIKLRDYAQVSRSRSYAYRKTLLLQLSPFEDENSLYLPSGLLWNPCELGKVRILMSRTTKGSDVCKPGAKIYEFHRSEHSFIWKLLLFQSIFSGNRVRISKERNHHRDKLQESYHVTSDGRQYTMNTRKEGIETRRITHYRENKGMSDRNWKPECSGDYGALLDCNQADRWEYAMCLPMRDGV
ncbi:hypothetical protein J6590_104633, partial [Homalodisca vitripennis]